MARKTRTLTLTDETFDALKTLALINKTSVSAIVEELGRQFVVDHSADLRRYYQSQISLFDVNEDKNSPLADSVKNTNN